MPILHKFHTVPPIPNGINGWDNRFQTHNAILDITPYEPEVIFIGTFNHGWPWNDADFFYGRGMYMWTILANLFKSNANVLTSSRTPLPIGNNTPMLSQIFEICIKGRITFADIVLGTKPKIATLVNQNNSSVLVNNAYNWSGYKDKPLDIMGGSNWLDDNVKNIVNYINNTPSIKHIYFTFKSGIWLGAKKGLIIAGTPQVNSCSIFTPTGNGFGHNLAFPFNERAWSLAHCWVWNGLHNPIPVFKIGYGHLDHLWLSLHNVNPNIF